MRWTGRLEGLPRFISHAFDFAQAPRKGMGSSLSELTDYSITNYYLPLVRDSLPRSGSLRQRMPHCR